MKRTASAVKDATPGQIDFRNKKKEKGQERAKALFDLMAAHKLNLPALERYVNEKDSFGMPMHPDVDEVVLPDPKAKLSRARIHQMLMRLDEYKAQSSWRTTRDKTASK